MTPSARRRLAHLLVLALLAVLAWFFLEPRRLLEALGAVRLGPLLVLLGVALADRLLMAVKWSQLLAATGVHLPLASVISAYLQASFVNRVVPMSLGGDIVRGVAASRPESRDRVVASMVMEKAVAVVGAVALALAGAAALAPALIARGWGSMVWSLAGLGAVVLVLILLSLSERVVRTLFRPVSGLSQRMGTSRLLGRLHAAYRGYRSRPGALAVHFLLTLIEQALQVLVVFLCARSVGIDAPASVLVPVIAVSELVRKLALVLQVWGLGELGRVLTLSLAAVDANRAVAVALLYHAVAWIVALPGALLLVLRRPAARTAA